MGKQKIQFEANKLAIRTRISEVEAKNKELEHEFKMMCSLYEANIGKLREESAYKMKVIHESADERINTYLKNTNDNFKQYSELLTSQVKEYLQNVKSKAASYNDIIDKRAETFIDRKVLDAVKSNQSFKGKGINNTTFVSGTTNNTTMISNANNSILK